ncbi:hypothetical protein GMES_1206 [Paraglaciecola mesophila KMM 241]|uniref:Uncharacterized protein n=1 Tax=Paraglaciecola mesophila KMM 241 TaxID=1128912 RepID=K6ZJE6_9ALTE|nr:hypothetical protein GMES_1206 [Paraglaciecola mesophila KMM 241]
MIESRSAISFYWVGKDALKLVLTAFVAKLMVLVSMTSC